MVLVGEALDELVGAGQPAGLDALFLGGVFIAPAQVVQDGAREQDVLLQHHRDVVAQHVQVVVPDVHAAHFHAAFGNVVQAGDQLDQAGLGRAGAADDAQRLAGLDAEGDVAEHRAAGAVLILEGDVVELDAAVLDLLDGGLGGGQVGGFVQHLDDAVAGGHRHAEHDKDHREHHQAHEDVHDVAEQGVELAGGDDAVQDIVGAEPGQGQVAAVDGQQHGGVVEAEAAFRLDELLVKVLAGLGVFFVLVLLADKALDHADGGDVLLHRGVEGVVVLKDAVKDLDGGEHDAAQHQEQKDHGHQEDQGQVGVDGDGHDQGEHQVDRGAHAHAGQHLEGVLDVGDVGGHAGDQARGGELVDVGEGIVLDPLEHGVAQVAGIARRGPRRAAAGRQAQQQRKGGHQQGEHAVLDDGVHIAFFDALVDDVGHQKREKNVHDGLERGQERRDDGSAPVLAEMGGQFFQHGAYLLIVCCLGSNCFASNIIARKKPDVNRLGQGFKFCS